jgi:hypothetical protein
MSLDGSGGDGASCSSSEAADEAIDEDLGDVTDDEDWASIGAAALRQGSFPINRGEGLMHSSYNYNAKAKHTHKKERGGGPASSTLARSAPVPQRIGKQQTLDSGFDFGSEVLMEGVGGDQEREAIQALLRLGSV